MRKLILAGLLPLVLLLAGCGGGSVPTSSSSSSGSGSEQPAANVVAITVDSGPDPTNVFDTDTPFVTITVCAPGSTTNCEQIDHVEVDTGSYGVRILSAALTNSTLAAALQPETASTGGSLTECTQFVDGFSWGPVKVANVQIGGESASNVPIQVLGDPNYEQEIPSSCSSTGGQEEDTVDTFGANGIIGVGVFGADCGEGCDLALTSGENPGWYYGCPSGGTSGTDCAEVAVNVNAQVTNPVVFFTATGDDNGVIIKLPSIPDPDGSATASGSLVFGIGTESNNGLGSATVLTADPNYGDIITTYAGTQLPSSFFDTGSNAYYFDASMLAPTILPDCPSSGSSSAGTLGSWLCPTTEQTLSLQNEGQVGTISDVSINIYNANTLFSGTSTENNTAFDDLGVDTGDQSSFCSSGAADCYFDFGLPFFFGRNVYIAIAGANTAGGEGPYYAY